MLHNHRGLASILWVPLLVCSCHQPDKQTAQAGTLPSTIQATMDQLIDPSADTLWASVGTIEQAQGETARRPRTDAEWKTLRTAAVKLVAGARHIKSGVPVGANGHGLLADADTPGIRTAAQIGADISRDPKKFSDAAERLAVGGEAALAAIDRRSSTGLLEAGARMDAACEACHHAYWYPRTPPLPLLSPDAFARQASHP